MWVSCAEPLPHSPRPCPASWSSQSFSLPDTSPGSRSLRTPILLSISIALPLRLRLINSLPLSTFSPGNFAMIAVYAFLLCSFLSCFWGSMNIMLVMLNSFHNFILHEKNIWSWVHSNFKSRYWVQYFPMLLSILCKRTFCLTFFRDEVRKWGYSYAALPNQMCSCGLYSCGQWIAFFWLSAEIEILKNEKYQLL
jgi:hypothetical protein